MVIPDNACQGAACMRLITVDSGRQMGGGRLGNKASKGVGSITGWESYDIIETELRHKDCGRQGQCRGGECGCV